MEKKNSAIVLVVPWLNVGEKWKGIYVILFQPSFPSLFAPWLEENAFFFFFFELDSVKNTQIISFPLHFLLHTKQWKILVFFPLFFFPPFPSIIFNFHPNKTIKFFYWLLNDVALCTPLDLR